MVSVGLFTNIKSGKNKADVKKYGYSRRLRRIREIIKDGSNGRLYATGLSKSYLSDLEKSVIKAYEDKPEVIVIDGGDGTASTVLTMLDKCWKNKEMPPIALTPGGTYNALAKRMGVKKSFAYLENIAKAESADKLTVKGVNMMRVIDSMGREHLSFSAGVGLPVAFLDEIYQKKHLKYLRVGLSIAKLICSSLVQGEYYQRFNKHTALRVFAKGNADKTLAEGEGRWLGILAQTIDSLAVPRFLPKPKIFRKAETEGRFQAVGTKLDLNKLLQYLPAVYSGDSVYYTEGDSEERTAVLGLDMQLKELMIQSNEPFRYQFNGELSFGNEPCITKELYLLADRCVNFVADDFG